MGIADDRVVINTAYLMWILDPGWETIGVSCAGIILVVLFSVLVIYKPHPDFRFFPHHKIPRESLLFHKLPYLLWQILQNGI